MELNQLHFFTAPIFFFLASAKTCKTCLLEAAPNPILPDSRNAEQIKYVGGEWNGDGESRYGFGLSCSRACLKIAFRQLCVPLCGRFGPDEGGVAGYVDRIGTKYAAKWNAQLTESNFQTHPSMALAAAVTAAASMPNLCSR